jgi:hypothetical protein
VIAFDEDVLGYFGKMNCIRAYDPNRSQLTEFQLIEQSISHALCRFYMPKNGKVKLFISHSKHDTGIYIAKSLQCYIQLEARLNTFFDVHDIDEGADFELAIYNGVEQSTLLILHSDTYCEREWCIKEVLHAKKKFRPIIRIQCYTNGENRTNPYIANTLVYAADLVNNPSEISKLHDIINCALMETLRHFYFEVYAHYKLYGIDSSTYSILPSYPELLNIRHLLDKNQNLRLIIYPDPPLIDAELEIIRLFFPGIQFYSLAQMIQA